MEEKKPQTPSATNTDRGGLEAVQGEKSGAVSTSPGSLAGKTIYVVDAHSLIHQVFHALPEMTSPQGEPVGAVFGFARDVLFLLEDKRPDYLLCAFDLPGETFRHQLYADYKANRPDIHEDLLAQIEPIGRLVDSLGIGRLAAPSYEADDILATVARKVEELGGECYLVTGDKDCRQLITTHTKIYNIRKNQVYDGDALVKEWGITPDQVVDFQALVGDATDNVPGVPLIGPKLARDLLLKHRTLEGVLDHAEDVSGEKRRQNLMDYRQQALLSRKLVRLKDDVPLEIDWESGRTGRIDRDRALDLFARLGFRGLGARVAALASGSVPSKKPKVEIACRVVDSRAALEELTAELASQPAISVDLETTSIQPRQAEIVGYALAVNDRRAWYVPVRGPVGETCLDAQTTLDTLRPVLENPVIGKIGQNLKYDMIVLRSAGVEVAGVAFDTMVASYLLEAGARNHNLDELARRYLGHTTVKIAELIGAGKQQKRMDEVPVVRVAEYAAEDALVPVLLRPILQRRMAQERLDDLFENVELPLIDVLVELEYNGIRLDVERLGQLSVEYGRRMEAIEREIYDLAGHPFNIASPRQLQQVLFEERKLPPLKKTKTGPSTDAEVLEELAAQDPLPAKIIEYRQYAKLKSTYVDALPQMVHPTTGRVHASFNQSVAATGRLSSSDPNLQNIPVRTAEGREIRSAFVPGKEGWVLLAADYSQIELRVLAHFSHDERLCEAFARDEDVHATVASRIYGIPLEEVTKEMRWRAKTVNFGVIYGQSPFGLAKQLGIAKEEAAKFIDAYFEGYPGIEEFLRRTLAECLETGYVKTILGRRRAIQGVRPDAGRQRNLAERTAINTVIQGSAADLIKLAMIAIHRRLRRERLPARMLLQIHDELVFESLPDCVKYLAELVATEMAAARPLDVPLKVDVSTGPNWAATEPLE